MILVDANLLIYAANRTAPQHALARSWLEERLSGNFKVGLPWMSLLAFMRITSNPRIFPSPVTVARAWEQVQKWLSSPVSWCPAPTERHQTIFADFVRRVTLLPNDLPDAHLAALSLEHGLVLCSTDSDFAKYPEVRWENPLN